MSALDDREYARLARFTERLLAPVPSEVNMGIARALLATKHRWQPLDLAFLRVMAARPSAARADYDRLETLKREAMEALP